MKMQGDEKVTENQEADEDFTSGFDSDASVTIKRPEDVSAGVNKETKSEQAPEDDKITPTEKEVEKAIEAVATKRELTEDQIKILEAAAAEVPELKKQNSKLFGTLGQLQQQFESLKNKDKGNGNGEAKPSAATAPEELGRLIGEEIESRVRVRADEELKDIYPDWREIVGASDTPDKNIPYRKWLATQPQDYQDKINISNSAVIIARSIDKFKAATESPPKAAQPDKARLDAKMKADAERRDRISNSQTPKTAGSHPARSKTADDEFTEGFAEG